MVADSGIDIARATTKDATAILALQRLAYQSEAALYNDWSIPPLTQTSSELSDEFETTVFLKASDDGTIVGSVRAKRSGVGCEIGRLIVHPDYQGRGIGRRLMHAIEAEVCAARYELFTGARSERSIRLYASLGYRTFRTQIVAPHLTLVFMEKLRPTDG